jgi:hypothetical protein
VNSRVAWLGGLLAACAAHAALCADLVSATQTLLVPNATGHALDLVDPGSGLRLASVPIDVPPRRVATAPDGMRAAVLACEDASLDRPGRVELRIVALDQPGEVRRITLEAQSCPPSLAWRADGSIELAGPRTTRIDPENGTTQPAQRQDPAPTPPGALSGQSNALASSIAVQQFLASGGRLADLAVTPVIPKAICHACTSDP